MYHINLKGKLHYETDSIVEFQGFQIFWCEFGECFLFLSQKKSLVIKMIANRIFYIFIDLTDHFRVRQTFLGQKFWPPNFFLKTYSPYAQRLGAVKTSHPPTPLGPQNPYLGVRPPKTEKLHILQGKFFHLLADHVL